LISRIRTVAPTSALLPDVTVTVTFAAQAAMGQRSKRRERPAFRNGLYEKSMDVLEVR
jgi:hypothetical protein